MKLALQSPIRAYVLDALRRYWPRGSEPIESLPIPRADEGAADALPPPTTLVELPAWANDLAVDGKLLAPAHTAAPPRASGPDWQSTDWLAAAFWYLNGTAERAHERRFGPIDSYSFRLSGWNASIWERAWVNRIALFLRRWGARRRGVDESELFGPLPQPEVILTHDVDAVSKTAAIRLKQSAFHLFNAMRALGARRPKDTVRRASTAARFLLGPGRYWRFEEIMRLEDRHGMRSHFNFYGGPGGRRRTLKQQLLDPAYCVEEPALADMIRRLRAGDWTVGLHPSFDARDDAEAIGRQRERLEKIVAVPVTSCRQHWLRFCWERTWKAQESAGLRLDTTLGFNDRPGFRNAAALRFRPWFAEQRGPMALEAVPLVLMDSHLYDYRPSPAAGLRRRMKRWLDEIRDVRGTATVVWHQRVLSPDYGWGDGYRALLELLREPMA